MEVFHVFTDFVICILCVFSIGLSKELKPWKFSGFVMKQEVFRIRDETGSITGPAHVI